MSAFLVEKTTIDRIVTLIDHERRQSEYFKRELEKDLKINFANPEWRSALGQKMWDLCLACPAPVPVAKPQFISWAALKDQFGFGYSRMDNFKAGFRAVLGDVCGQYREAKVDLDDRGMSLQASAPPVPGRLLIV